jgi:hypothetical protein
MKRITIGILCLCACTLLAVKCHDDDGLMFCSFNYGKVKFIPDSADGAQVVEPQFDGDKPRGTYSAEPEGLDIDEETGEINIDNSTPGKEYTITFISRDKKMRCETSIYIEEPEVKPITCVFKYEKEVYIPQEVAKGREEQLGVPMFEDELEIDGTFTVKPSGLDIDPLTGIFSVNGSASGIEYTVTYTSKDGNTSCETSVIISGIDYLDAIVDVSSPETSTVRPILDALIDSQAPTGDGFYDVDGSARQSNLAIDPNTGVIDLRTTLQQIDLREFGGNGQEPVIPSEQFSRKYTIKYSFNKDDADLVSSVEIVIYWFPTDEDIPQELLDLLKDKQLYPENGRTLRPPPLLMGKGNYTN